MIIKKITKLKDGKYKVELDSYCFITYDDIIINHNLLYKKKIDNNLLSVLSRETAYYEAYNKAVKYCMKKIRSEYEIKEYLQKLEISECDINKIIDKLKKINLINDRLYARCYINDRLLLSKDGLNKIKQDLIDNKIDSKIIYDEVSKIDFNIYDKLEKMIVKRIKSNHKYSNYILKNKIVGEMVNLGYDYDDIVEIYEKNFTDNYDILVKEYNKLYNKYSKKYQDSKLEYIIKNKLFSKGFNYDDIKKEDLN